MSSTIIAGSGHRTGTTISTPNNSNMKFATKMVALQHQAWAEYYLDYNGLKRILAEIDKNEDDEDLEDLTINSNSSTQIQLVSLLSKKRFENGSITSEKFLSELYQQVQMIALFKLKEEGIIADGLQVSRKELETLAVDCKNSSISKRISSSAFLSTRFRQLRDKYNHIGAELLQLLQFVDLNIKGILRLLKKHDKRVEDHKHQDLYELFLFGKNRTLTRNCPYHSATLMASLQNHQALDALCVTLHDGYTILRLLQQQYCAETATIATSDTSEFATPIELDYRGLSASATTSTSATQHHRRLGRSPKGLGRKHKSIQGLSDAFQTSKSEDDDITSPILTVTNEMTTACDTEFHSNPNICGAPRFALLADRHMYKVLPQEDFIMAQIYAARRNIVNQRSNVMNMLATTALGFDLDPSDEDSQQIKAEYERAAALEDYKLKSAMSSTLNYISSFIYMANYLIVVPTVVTYSQKLGANPALSSAIVGMTPFATIFSTIVYSWWTSYSYRTPLLVASLLNVVGNIIYALGYPMNSMSFVLIGRLLSGMGSCRPINRRYIADAYSTAERTAASAHFVAVGCFGMALGPFLGSVLHRIARHSKNPYWQVENAPGWLMAVVWFIYVIFHLIFFVDPPREDPEDSTPRSSVTASTKEDTEESKPLLTNGNDDDLEDTRIPIWRNVPVVVNFFIYFIQKLLMECVSSSTSILTYFYFGWPGSWSGYWLAFLCLLVLPVNLVVAYLSKIYEDREMMVVMQIATVLGCIVIMRFGDVYYVEQYLVGTLIIVVCSNMVEGPNMSLLSKTIPKSWRKGFLNVGLLATEAATMGRTAGDAFLALCGTAGIEHQLNLTFGSMILATVFTLWITYRYYDSLIPTEDKTL